MSTLLIRRRRPIGDPPAGRFHDGTAGAGRIVQSLADSGLALDNMRIRQLLLEPSAPVDDLDPKALDEVFDRVVLGSHLVNVADPVLCISLLAVASYHCRGTVLVEHHPVDWLQTAADVPPGGSVGMVDVRVDPPFVSAVSVLDIGGRVVRQPFRARVLSEDELDAALADAGLRRVRRVSSTWIEARRAQPIR